MTLHIIIANPDALPPPPTLIGEWMFCFSIPIPNSASPGPQEPGAPAPGCPPEVILLGTPYSADDGPMPAERVLGIS